MYLNRNAFNESAFNRGAFNVGSHISPIHLQLCLICSFVWYDCSKAYSEPYQTSKMERFAEIVYGLSVVNYFSKTLHFRCLTGFWIRLCSQRKCNCLCWEAKPCFTRICLESRFLEFYTGATFLTPIRLQHNWK